MLYIFESDYQNNRDKYDDEWYFKEASNLDIKPWWYPGHNWIRAHSSKNEYLWFDPRAGTNGEGTCDECY